MCLKILFPRNLSEVFYREVFPLRRERWEAEIRKRGIASQRRKRVSNIHVAEHVSGDKPLSRKPLVLFSYHYARRPYESWPAYRARSNPTARHSPRINVAKLPINPCHCRLIAVVSSGNQDRSLCSFPLQRSRVNDPLPFVSFLIRRGQRNCDVLITCN